MRCLGRPFARLRLRPRRRLRPVRVWPGEAALWLDENGVRHPRAARHVLAALAGRVTGRPTHGRYAARTAEGGTILTGPVSALALHDAEATIQFVVRVTPYGYGEEAF